MRAMARGFGEGLTLARVNKPLKEEAWDAECDLWGKCEADVGWFGPWRVCQMYLRWFRGREWHDLGVDNDADR